MKRMLVLSALAGVMWCQNLSYEPDPGWQVPPDAAPRANPLAKRTGLVGGGKKLFARNCVECHGENGSGMEKKHSADLQLPVVQSQSDGALFWKITNGNPDRGMPSFSRLPELQRWQLVLYLRSLRTAPATLSESHNPRR
ncbi:MAG: c-type cytochrome [Acidobacteriia bacterium]|nr:c-type cytochrome [Terriglobia bacterium]